MKGDVKNLTNFSHVSSCPGQSHQVQRLVEYSWCRNIHSWAYVSDVIWTVFLQMKWVLSPWLHFFWC